MGKPGGIGILYDEPRLATRLNRHNIFCHRHVRDQCRNRLALCVIHLKTRIPEETAGIGPVVGKGVDADHATKGRHRAGQAHRKTTRRAGGQVGWIGDRGRTSG